MSISKILIEIYNDRGVYDNFEKYVKSILESNGFVSLKKGEDTNKYIQSYCYQPNGSQCSPDFYIYTKDKRIAIECKSSKSKHPVWNGGLPSIADNYIYIFNQSKQHINYVFMAHHIITEKEEEMLKEFHERQKEICKEFNKKVKHFEYYPRAMYNQKKILVVEERDRYLQDSLKYL